MRTWFNIQNAASEDEATVSIYDEIGMWGITAADFNREFKAITGKIVNVEINSPGGSVFDGIAIYNMLIASGKTINMKVMGVAASIASLILMAGNKIVMPANAMVLVHSPKGGMFGTAEEMRDMADVLDKVKASLVGVYMKRTGKTEEEVTALLAKDTWMTAAEAKAAGFADEVIDAVDAKALFDLERIPEPVRAVFKAAAQSEPTAEEIAAATAAQHGGGSGGAPAVPMADQIVAAAKDAGFEAHAPLWAMTFSKLEDVMARIAVAREIKALCGAVKHADKADGYIAAGKTMAEVHIALTNAIAATDQHIDTSRKNSNQPAQQGPSAVTTAGIWAARNKQLTGV